MCWALTPECSVHPWSEPFFPRGPGLIRKVSRTRTQELTRGGRGVTSGKGHEVHGIESTAEEGWVEGLVLAEGRTWGYRNRASSRSSGAWMVPGSNVEPLQGFKLGQATVWSEC